MKITEPFKPFEAGGKVYHGYIRGRRMSLTNKLKAI